MYSSLLDKLGDHIVAISPRPTGNGAFKPSEAITVGAIVAVIQAVYKAYQEHQLEGWKKNVSSELNRIADLLQAIQQQLIEFQLWTDERISEETRRQYHSNIVSRVHDINTILTILSEGGELTKYREEDLQKHHHELRNVVGSLMTTDGFLHVNAVVVGVACILPLYALFNRTEEAPGWCVPVLQYLRASLDPANPKSVEFARNMQANRFISANTTLTRRLGQEFVTNFEI